MQKYILLIGVSFFLLMIGCRDLSEPISVEAYSPELAIPVINDASLTFPDAWQIEDPNQSLVIEPNGNMILKYESPKAYVQAIDIFGTLTFLLRETLPENADKVPLSSALPESLIIEEAQIKAGTILFTFEQTAVPSATTEVIFTIKEITKDGKPLEIRTTTQTTTTLPTDLTGYLIEPTNNQLTIEYSATNQSGVPQQLNKITMFASPQVEVLKGFWGRELYQLAPTIIPIDLFENKIKAGNIRFASPKITAYVESSFGVPVRSQIDLLKAYLRGGEVIDIDYSSIDNKDINYPELTEIGASKTTALFVDNTNSNLVDVFNGDVNAIEYGLSAIINPENDTSITGFMTDTSFFSAQVFVEVPIEFSSNNFIIEDTYAVSFKENKDLDNITEGEFKLIVENGMPLAAGVQLYFLDTEDTVLDSLFQEVPTLVEGAPVDAAGQATGKTETITYIPISAAQMQQIRRAQFIRVRSFFKTVGSLKQAVTLLAEQEIRVRLGLKVRL